MSRKKNTPTNKRNVEVSIIVCILVIMAVMIIRFLSLDISFQRYNTSTLHYVRGVVKEVQSESLYSSAYGNDIQLGEQTVVVTILEGELKNHDVLINNYISVTHNVVLKTGNRVIVCADMPEGVEPYYSIYNYDRSWLLVVVAGFFLILVAVIGRKKGIMSCIGLLFTLCILVCYLLPAIFEGKNAIVATLVTVLLSASVTCFCIGGIKSETLRNIISVSIGCMSAGLIFSVFMVVLKITPSSINEVESLVLISQETSMDIKGILFAGVLISAMGAVMDVAVSMGAAMREIKNLNPETSGVALFRSGMNIGRDMIGTMTNTLILAFVGGSISSLILLMSYGVQLNQLLSSDFLALEVAQGIASSSAVVLTVPISAAVFVFDYKTGHQKNF